jgi:hypothetical protein
MTKNLKDRIGKKMSSTSPKKGRGKLKPRLQASWSDCHHRVRKRWRVGSDQIDETAEKSWIPGGKKTHKKQEKNKRKTKREEKKTIKPAITGWLVDILLRGTERRACKWELPTHLKNEGRKRRSKPENEENNIQRESTIAPQAKRCPFHLMKDT